MASLRLNFNGDRRNGRRQYRERPRMHLFPYPARYMAGGCNPDAYPRSGAAYEQNKAAITGEEEYRTAGCETEKSMLPSLQESLEWAVCENGKKENNIPADDYITTQKEDPLPKTEPAGAISKNDPEVSINEKVIGFLDTSENGLISIKNQVDMARSAFEEMMFKLDSIMSVLDVIHSNEERRINKPEASLAFYKESKDTVDEILELLQTPALQNVLRQFLISFLVKGNAPKQPEH